MNTFEIKARWENSIFIRNNDINSISFDFIMRINEIIGLLDIANGYNKYTERFMNIKEHLYRIYSDNKSVKLDEIFSYFIREYINPSKSIKSDYIFSDYIVYYDNHYYTINYFIRDRYHINHTLHIKIYMYPDTAIGLFNTSIEVGYLTPHFKEIDNCLIISDSDMLLKWCDDNDNKLVALYNPDKENLNKFSIYDIFKYINSKTCENDKKIYILKDLKINIMTDKE